MNSPFGLLGRGRRHCIPMGWRSWRVFTRIGMRRTLHGFTITEVIVMVDHSPGRFVIPTIAEGTQQRNLSNVDLVFGHQQDFVICAGLEGR